MTMNRLSAWSAALLLGIVILLGGNTTFAQATPSAASTPAVSGIAQNATTTTAGVPDLSGIWELRSDSRRQLDQAQLTPAGTKMMQDAAALVRAGHTIVLASRWCHYKGVPFMMGQSPPIDIIQTKDEIAVFAEQISSPRHIYIDGRVHPDPKLYEPTTNGHSVGHWEGDTLVVDTVGFNDHGVNQIPGGGYRTHTSHLVEHFHLIDGGQKMIGTFTWDDPVVYVKPHSYEFTYYKMPYTTYVFEDDCDSSDTTHWLDHSTTEPPQQ